MPYRFEWGSRVNLRQLARALMHDLHVYAPRPPTPFSRWYGAYGYVHLVALRGATNLLSPLPPQPPPRGSSGGAPAGDARAAPYCRRNDLDNGGDVVRLIAMVHVSRVGYRALLHHVLAWHEARRTST